MDLTVYNICEDILKRACFSIQGDYEKNHDKELIKFLTTDYKKYDFMFEEYECFETIQQKNEYKAIMMLIIVSTSYKMTAESLQNNRSYEGCLNQLEDMDKLTPKIIYKKFRRREKDIFEYIADFYTYIYSNYIYANDCLDSVLKQKRLGNILKINPFEIVGFMNYIDPQCFLCSERTLQDYLTIQENAIVEIMEENGLDEEKNIDCEELQQKIIEMTEEKLNYDEQKIRNFYGYIFGNIYEALKVSKITNLDFGMDRNEIAQLVSYLEDESTGVEELMDRYYNDADFFDLVSQIFLIANEDVLEEDLILQRDNLKQTDGVEIEKKLNPYYDDEEYAYQKIKEGFC